MMILSGDPPRSRVLGILLVVIIAALAVTPLLFPGAKAMNVATKICIFAALVAPCSAPDDASAAALRQAIAAALADPEQQALARSLGQPAARPVVWAQRESTGSQTAPHRP